LGPRPTPAKSGPGIPQFVGVDFSLLLLVEDTKHVTKFLLVLVVLHLLTNNAAELIEQNVPGTYSQNNSS